MYASFRKGALVNWIRNFSKIWASRIGQPWGKKIYLVLHTARFTNHGSKILGKKDFLWIVAKCSMLHCSAFLRATRSHIWVAPGLQPTPLAFLLLELPSNKLAVADANQKSSLKAFWGTGWPMVWPWPNATWKQLPEAHIRHCSITTLTPLHLKGLEHPQMCPPQGILELIPHRSWGTAYCIVQTRHWTTHFTAWLLFLN